MKGGSNRLMTSAETADLLGIHIETLYRRWREWGLTGIYVGRNLKFRERDLTNWLDRKAA